ncbi:HPr(Ser) kinase/phosphatase [Mycoplasmopsis gallinarum]|uniref:HPr kinase/phosphorylase n=1 Tax=Mycoplasmopsis gallinarum TaxID=29557 RepID=A0A168R9I0_9BACT|nr:HPr(Ser) kinase/phosphatase [Mycoplasmopsis gallinarum]OAB48751.1 HPr kinase/phosphorylase [Mycoplasmopsis gallinarum]
MKRKSINVKKIISKFNISLINGEKELIYRNIFNPAIKRLGLELAGIIDNTRYNRNVICWGTTESVFFKQQGKIQALKTLDKILSVEPPLVILSKGITPLIRNWIVSVANKYKIPVYHAAVSTSKITTSIGTYLSDFFSEEVQVHGCLVSVGGTGVLIVGKSGVGKSEATLELVLRGHIFISDDAVLIKHIGANFYGTSPAITKDLIEVRGIGFTNIKYTYGIKAITEGCVINLVVELVNQNENVIFDRLGVEYQKYEIMDGSIPKIQVPVKNGFSAASLIEAAVSTYLAKKDGLNVIDLIENRRKEINNA